MAKNSFSPTQLQALDLMLQGVTITEIAQQLDIGRSTIHQWCRENTLFISAFHAARQRHQADIMDRVHALAAPSLSLLNELLQDDKASDTVRLRAALAVLKSVEINGPVYPFTPAQEDQINEVVRQEAAAHAA